MLFGTEVLAPIKGQNGQKSGKIGVKSHNCKIINVFGQGNLITLNIWLI